MNINFHKICICVLTVCYLPVLFLGLFDLDEGAFAATSLQMIKQNQYILPYIGEELRLEKPILTYWIQVISMHVFGVNEFALRFPSVVASFFWAFYFADFVKRYVKINSRSEIFINLLTIPGIFIISFAATAEALLNLFITLLMINIYDYSERKDKKYLIWSGIFVGLGFLTKGLTIIAIGGMISLIYFIYQRKLIIFFNIVFSWRSWLSFLIVVLPWVITLYQNIGLSELDYLFLGQTFGRFTNTFEKHDGPFFYYLLILPILLLPYFWDVLKGFSELNIRGNRFESFILIWFIFVLVFFSFSSTKLPHYLIYGTTPLAYLIYKNHQNLENSKVNLLAVFFHSFFWLIILSMPFYLSYLISVQQNYEVSDIALEEFKNDSSFIIFILLLILFFIFSFFLKFKLLFMKRISAISLLAILSVKILPLINESLQGDIRKVAFDAKTISSDISAFKLNKPSFSFYADKIFFRDLEEADIIFTRVDKLAFIVEEYEIISKHGNYVLLKIKQ